MGRLAQQREYGYNELNNLNRLKDGAHETPYRYDFLYYEGWDSHVWPS